jgi:hypothetical protein
VQLGNEGKIGLDRFMGGFEVEGRHGISYV